MLKFSVIIPTCRREDLLARCLESLRPGNQTAEAASYEVIVTDDGGAPGAQAMMRAQFSWARWVRGPSRGPAANRNNGARHAKGEWICFIDDDCVPSKKWLAVFDDLSKTDSLDLIEGRTEIPDQIDSPFHHAVQNETGGAYWSCNLAIRRESFQALGGFDEDFLEAASEDMEFAYRFRLHRLRVRFSPEALVYHPVRYVGWGGIWKRLFMIRWAALYHYKINEGLHLSDSSIKNVLCAFRGEILNLLRATWRDFSKWNRAHGKTQLFQLVLRWVSAPLVLPYYLYWVHRYHQELNERENRTPGSCAQEF